MNRRTFLTKASLSAVAAGTVWASAPAVQAQPTYAWKMVTTWPKDFPGYGTGANRLAQTIAAMSKNRLTITVYAAGELVPAFEAFDAVASGTAEMGHAVSYYWKAKHVATQFFTCVPFGLNAQESIAWLQYGGGQALWDELYAAFNLRPFAVGNTGVQMGGWFNKEITTVADFVGLRMRIPGLGAEALTTLGAHTVTLPASETVPALQAGRLDAAEWVGPYNDLPLGFHTVAKYYYWPGWHEPSNVAECFVNKRAYEALPVDLQAIIAHAAQDSYSSMLDEYTTRNGSALVELLTIHKVQLRRFPDKVLKQLGEASKHVVAQVAAQDPFARQVYDSYTAFRDQAIGWAQISEEGYSLARTLAFA